MSLVTKENLEAVLEGAEDEIRSMMQEDGLSPWDDRVNEILASLLELVKYSIELNQTEE